MLWKGRMSSRPRSRSCSDAFIWATAHTALQSAEHSINPLHPSLALSLLHPLSTTVTHRPVRLIHTFTPAVFSDANIHFLECVHSQTCSHVLVIGRYSSRTIYLVAMEVQESGSGYLHCVLLYVFRKYHTALNIFTYGQIIF